MSDCQYVINVFYCMFTKFIVYPKPDEKCEKWDLLFLILF